MGKLGLRGHNSFSGNICFEFSVLVLCSVYEMQRPIDLEATIKHVMSSVPDMKGPNGAKCQSATVSRLLLPLATLIQ